MRKDDSREWFLLSYLAAAYSIERAMYLVSSDLP